MPAADVAKAVGPYLATHHVKFVLELKIQNFT